MPEGPMVLLFRDELSVLKGRQILQIDHRRSKPDLSVLEGKTLRSLSAWGKYLFLHVGPGELHLRIHWGMFGVYYLDEPRKGKEPVLHLTFSNGRELFLYSVSLRLLEGPLDRVEYDPHIDIMSPDFDTARAVEAIKTQPAGRMICDVLMDQRIFAGLGNVIKNESLFALRIDPESAAAGIPVRARKLLVADIVEQAQLFLEERRASGGYGHSWVKIYRKKTCPDCGKPVQKGPTGEGQRKSHWCPHCQLRYEAG